MSRASETGRRALRALCLSAGALCLAGHLDLRAMDQSWEERDEKHPLTWEQLEQAVLDLSAEQYGIRDAAARKLIRSADDRVLLRLTDEAEGGLEANRRACAMQLLSRVRERMKATTYVKDFWVLGPFPLTEDEKNAVNNPQQNDCLFIPTGLDRLKEIDLEAEVPLRPDQDPKEAKLKWRRPHQGEKGTLDLCQVCKETPEFAHVFLLTFVYSDRDRAATFWFGSDDGVALWVNGQCLFYGDYHRGLTVDSDQVTVDLKKGWNPVLFRIAQGWGAWAFSFRVADRLGRPWPDRWVDPDCGGQARPVIPAPIQPQGEAKSNVIPEALRSQSEQHQKKDANLRVQLLQVR